MAVQIRQVQNCCTVAMIYSFGDTSVSSLPRYKPTKSKLKEEIRGKLNRATDGGYAIVIAYTNSNQITARDVLSELGFQRTRPLQSKKHSTKLQMWWMPIEDWKNREAR